MRLSEVLDDADLKKAGIVLIGTIKTGEHVYAVIARRGDKVMPIPKIFHLVEITPDNTDPDLDSAEIQTIHRRFLTRPFHNLGDDR